QIAAGSRQKSEVRDQMSEDGGLAVSCPWSVVRCKESIEKGTLHPVPCTLYHVPCTSTTGYWILCFSSLTPDT
ncbi:MAG: hypothetical protein R3339_12285, partial [Thermodesulfobacteriota bacterium]|nr:hypothetical protein [Thermodesulfobacteriota bacterium]